MSAASAEKPVVAAFDFDGTLTHRDTLVPFLLHVVGLGHFVRNAWVLFPTFAGYGLGIIPNNLAKQRVISRFFAGLPIATLRNKATEFAEHQLPKLIRQEAAQRFAWHKQQGHHCIVISASLELYVRPWALKTGFDDVLATQLEIRPDGSVSGNLLGANCFGIEKVRRLDALLGARSNYILYAYGDSRGDKELLSVADYAYYRKMN